jgi:hypothetical protein
MEGIQFYAGEVACDDAEAVDFKSILEDQSNDQFYVKPTFVDQYGGIPSVVYGIYNRKTGVMEADTRQLSAAKEWVDALTRIANEGPPIPIERVQSTTGGTIN